MYIIVILIIISIILSELVAYFWHKYLAHSEIINSIKNTHDIHHQIIDDKAEGILLGCFYYFYFFSPYYLYYIIFR